MDEDVGKGIVRIFSVLSYIKGGLLLIGGLLLVILSMFRDLWIGAVMAPGQLLQGDLVFVIVLLMVLVGISSVVLGFFLMWVGRGLWTFEPWSRWVMVTVGIILFVSSLMALPSSIGGGFLTLIGALIVLSLFLFSTSIARLFMQRQRELQEEYDETVEVLEHARKRIAEEREKAKAASHRAATKTPKSSKKATEKRASAKKTQKKKESSSKKGSARAKSSTSTAKKGKGSTKTAQKGTKAGSATKKKASGTQAKQKTKKKAGVSKGSSQKKGQATKKAATKKKAAAKKRTR